MFDRERSKKFKRGFRLIKKIPKSFRKILKFKLNLLIVTF